MNNHTVISERFYNRSMIMVAIAQFFSALSDNALLFATIALIKHHVYPDWSQPFLQMLFVFTYILLAPFVGQLADYLPKSRVMMMGNGAKLIGAFVILLNIDIFVGYTIVGIGAAIYSPAKYGILNEIVAHKHLVKANGLIESSTVMAILLGALLGGYLADISILLALSFSFAGYFVALVANIFIPSIASINHKIAFNVKYCFVDFFQSFITLWKNPQSMISLLGSSAFWGAGITLRFLLILWVPYALGVTDNFTPTFLNAIVAIGIAVGAGLASKFMNFERIKFCLFAAIAMGVIVIVFSMQSHLYLSYILLIIIGVLGGFFIVPLNALLQDVGKRTVGTGKAVAIQNLSENAAMLIMLGLYLLAVACNISIVLIGCGFGVLLILFYLLLWLKN